jgi:hypothetical protein
MFLKTYSKTYYLLYMETFNTQMMLSDVRTDVSVQILADDTFACTLLLADFFDGGEIPASEHAPDVTLKYTNGDWKVVGESKMTFSEPDLQNLQQAIEDDYINRSN